MIYRHLLLNYLVRPFLTAVAIIFIIVAWLRYRPVLETDMFSNLVLGIMAALAVAGFTVVQGMVTESWPVLRRAWLFKGNRHFNVAYADAVPAVVIQGMATQAHQVVFVKPPSTSVAPLTPFIMSRPVPNSEVRAFKYIVKGFPEIDFDFVPDTGAIQLQAPIIAFGSESSNYCTNQIMMALGFSSVWQTGTARTAYSVLAAAAMSQPPGFEYGVIAVTGSYHGLGIACWGLGETGTAGAAWFLANRWIVLSQALNDDFDTDFVALLKFPMGEENQGHLLRIYRPDEMHLFGSHL